MALEDVQAQRDALAAFEQGGVPLFQRPEDERDLLIRAAAAVAGGRSQGLSDDQTLQRLAQNVLSQANKQELMTPQLVESLLNAEGLGMDERDVKGNIDIAREEGENYGYASQEDYDRANQAQNANKLIDQKRKALRTVRQKQRRGEYVDPKFIQKLEDSIAKAASGQKTFDFGLVPLDREKEDNRPEWLKEIDPGEEKPILVGQGAEDPVKREKRLRVAAMNDRAEGIAAVNEANRRFKGELTDDEISKEAAARARVVADQNPLLSSVPVESLRTAGIDQPMPDVLNQMEGTKKGFRFRDEDEGKVWQYKNDRGERRRVPITPADPATQRFDNNDIDNESPEGLRRVPVRRVAGKDSSISEEDAAAAIREQLRARRERGRAGAIERIAAENRRQANKEVVLDINQRSYNEFGVRNISGLPTLDQLGAASYGKTPINSDMGVVLGKQRPTRDALLVERPDGSRYYVDPVTNDLAGNVQLGPDPQIETPATDLNAPYTPRNAVQFIDDNLYDNYGAQFFGDESIIANMDAKGSGGGIPQVNISGETGAFAEAVKAKLGLETAPQLRGAADLQAIVDQYIAMKGGKKVKGPKKFFRMENGEQIFTENPGVDEVMHDMKMVPADQQRLANALFQLEAARAQNVNLDRKKEYYDGGRFAPQNLGQIGMEDVVFGVDDPARGGDRLVIQKGTPAEQARFRKASDPDAAKPFVGLTGGMQRRVGDVQKWKGMNADEAEAYLRKRNAANAAKNPKRKRNLAAEERRIRQVREGNERADRRYRAQQQLEANRPFNRLGKIYPNQAAAPPFKQEGDPSYQPKQPIREAMTPQTIAPQPGDVTGNQSRPFRGQFSRNLLNQELKRRNRRTLGIGAASAGATAGLAALISGEREEREEEAYR